jgi:hypothetical protein
MTTEAWVVEPVGDLGSGLEIRGGAGWDFHSFLMLEKQMLQEKRIPEREDHVVHEWVLLVYVSLHRRRFGFDLGMARCIACLALGRRRMVVSCISHFTERFVSTRLILDTGIRGIANAAT